MKKRINLREKEKKKKRRLLHPWGKKKKLQAIYPWSIALGKGDSIVRSVQGEKVPDILLRKGAFKDGGGKGSYTGTGEKQQVSGGPSSKAEMSMLWGKVVP